MCPLTLGVTQSSGSPQQLGEAEWEQVKRMGASVGRVMILGFGEPMTHPKFVPMLFELDELGIETSFSTNGIGGELIADRLAELKHLRHINISIDSPDERIFKEIRGGELQRVLVGMRALAAAVAGRVTVTVASVVMKSNVRSLLAFPSILREAGIRYYTLSGLHDYTRELQSEQIHRGRVLQTFLPARRLHVLLDKLKAECAKNGVELLLEHRTQLDFYLPQQSATEFFEEGGHAGHLTRACTVPFDSIYFDSQGKAFPCCHSAGSEALGDLRTETIEQIWSGSRIRKFRSDLLDARTTPTVCRSCSIAPLGDHPYRLYRAEIVDAEPLPDRTGTRVRVLNKGLRPWNSESPLRLAPTHPHDRQSAYYHPSWLSPTRAAGPDHDVQPGETATIDFEITPVPENPREHFQLLIEGKHWLPDTIVELPLGGASELHQPDNR
jgi:radical SAM protein with 4Fe4S-binding SPASM domain